MSKKGNSVFEDILNVTANALSFGTIGVGDDGVESGIVTDLAVDTLKDVTGATAAEDANKITEQQIEENKAGILADKELAREKNAADQLKASNLAGGVRKGRTASSSRSRTSKLGSNNDDFLGL